MDKRSEPRFQIRSAIKIAAIDHPEQVSEALLLDVSGAGLKIVADNWWPVNTCIVVEMENHLVVARVRNIVARGPKFSLGAEKLYSVLKHTLPAGVSRTVWHNLLRAEMRDLPAAPERATTEHIEPLEIAPPEIAGPVETPSAIAEPEGAVRKITLRAPEPPTANVADAAPELAEPPSQAASLQIAPAEQPRTPDAIEASRAPIQRATPEQEAPVEPPAAQQATNVEPPTEAQATPAPGNVTQPAQEAAAPEQPRKLHAAPAEPSTPLEERSPEALSNAQPLPADSAPSEPRIAGAIPETRPAEAPPVPCVSPECLETLPVEPLPKALPTLRESVVPVDTRSDEASTEHTTDAAPLSETAAPIETAPVAASNESTNRAVRENDPQPERVRSSLTRARMAAISQTPEQMPAGLQETHSPHAAPQAQQPLEQPSASALRQTDAGTEKESATPLTNGVAPDAHVQPAKNWKAGGDPPLARPFPLVPTAARLDSVITTLKLTPVFGPAYGMAPTADGLTPLSVMPQLPAKPSRQKPRWVMPSTVLAAILGLAGLAFYYGPFRPKSSGSPKTVAPHAAPLTIPAVTETEPPTAAPTSTPAQEPVEPVTQASTINRTSPNAQPAPATQPAPNAQPAPVASVTKVNPVAQTAPAPVPPVAAKTSPAPVPPVAAKTAPAPVPAANAAATSATPQAKPAAPVTAATLPPAGGAKRVNITAASLLWFSACYDGKPAFAKVMHTGDTMDIDFHQAVVFKLGNSAAAQMTLDGKPLGAIGPPGSVKIVELSAAGLRELPATTAAGAECRPMQAAAKP
jgi:Domain of unknown function (DUF4115)